MSTGVVFVKVATDSTKEVPVVVGAFVYSNVSPVISTFPPFSIDTLYKFLVSMLDNLFVSFSICKIFISF